MPESVKIDHSLDCKGLLCPLPIIRTKQAIDKMTIGQVLEMVSTDAGSIPDMEAWSRRTGHALLEARRDGDLYRFLVRKAK